MYFDPRAQHRAGFIIVLAAVLTSACTTAGPAGSGAGSVPSTAASVAEATPTASPMPTLPPGALAVFDLPFRPSGIAVAGDWIWAEDHAETNAVYAVDPETGATMVTVQVARPCDLAVTDGRLWVADLHSGEVLALDLHSGEVLNRTEDLRGPCGLQAVAGAIWFAVDSGLARLDITTGDVTTAELASAGFPGAGRPLWVTIYGTDQVGRVDPTTGAVSQLTTIPGGPTEEMPVASGFGSVWVGHGPTNRLYRLNGRTGAIEAEIEVTRPTRLLVTDTGVWLTSYPGGVVERIDPTTNNVVFHTEPGGTLNGIAEGFGSIWVAVTGSKRLYRFDPSATLPPL